MAIIPSLDLGSLWVGDVPLGETRADFYDEAGDVVQISEYSSWSAEMFDAEYVSVGTLTGSEHGQHLMFPWPETSILETPGIYTIVIKFFDADGVAVTCEPWRFVVQSNDGWLTLEQTRQEWPDAPTNDLLLAMLLESARTQCEAYAPVLGLTDRVPSNYRHAQLLQTRALYMATAVNSQDTVGIGDMQIRVFPLDWTVKALLRPKTAKPVLA